MRSLGSLSLLLFALASTPAAAQVVTPGWDPSFGPPYAGVVNHAQAANNFRWGWFGAERYTPAPQWHRDYTGRVMRWHRPVYGMPW